MNNEMRRKIEELINFNLEEVNMLEVNDVKNELKEKLETAYILSLVIKNNICTMDGNDSIDIKDELSFFKVLKYAAISITANAIDIATLAQKLIDCGGGEE